MPIRFTPQSAAPMPPRALAAYLSVLIHLMALLAFNAGHPGPAPTSTPPATENAGPQAGNPVQAKLAG